MGHGYSSPPLRDVVQIQALMWRLHQRASVATVAPNPSRSQCPSSGDPLCLCSITGLSPTAMMETRTREKCYLDALGNSSVHVLV